LGPKFRRVVELLGGDDFLLPALGFFSGSLVFVTAIRDLGNWKMDGRMAFVGPIEKGTLAARPG